MGAQYSSCLNLDYLTNTAHWSAEDAYGTVELAARSNWTCTPDNLKGTPIVAFAKHFLMLSELVANFKCYISAEKKSHVAFQKCTDTFTAEMKKEPAKKCQ